MAHSSHIPLSSKQKANTPYPAKLKSNVMSPGHTFLCKEGAWKALGYFSDAEGNVHSLEGEATIIKKSRKFVSELKIIHRGNFSSVFYHHFEITEHQSQEYDLWLNFSLLTGELEGKMMLMNEYIFILFKSPNGKYSGVENLERIDDLHYKNHGYAFVNEQKMASWVLDWRRVR